MTGTPLLLIHAFPFDSRMWRPQVEAIGTSRMVLTPDLRGFGRNRDEPYPTSIEQHARDCLTLLDRSGVSRAIVAGLSMGGYVALAMQRLAPERLAALMLCDTKAAPDSPEARKGRDARIDRIRKEGIAFLPDDLLPGLVAESSSTNAKLELRRIMLEQDPQGIECALAALRDRPDSSEVLPSIRVPCRLVCGELDSLTPPDVMAAMVRHIDGATLDVLPGAGHLSSLEAPDAFNDILLALLQRIP